MESQSSPPPLSTDKPLKLLGVAYRGFQRIVDAPLRELGFAMSQLPVLVSLKHGNALPQSELARIAGVEQPSMAQLLNRMERDGLIQRRPDPDDRRSRLIALTPQARERLPAAQAVMEAASATATAGFSAADMAQLQSLMVRLNANLEASG
ncbi:MULTISPECIES: MarR family winged helix-turn-helix transcriptional regulator [Stenotrophomonas]|uniref:MarR family transcriptional regulator n=1 Tax=Stenotrophomonas rhizophila TaxID=216778 RepID=A0A498CEZ7_9GAMM|nr:MULTISPECIES: MarR family transcriptional regulator [Stenotrophomonas]KAB7632292.1 MarR family transcriptional regulator [Stenotrophomonas rhizophila]RLK56197.1 DNA-binding MarR family transcriptional regulator [Stenotrophomonas rhizophila]